MPKTDSVEVDLPPHVAEDIDRAVDRGHYDDRESAVGDAVRGFFGGYESSASSSPS